MGGSSSKMAYVVEKLINALEKKYIEQFYGEGTYLKIRDVIFSHVKNTCLVDCVVILGENLETTMLDDQMTRMLVYNIMDKLYLDLRVNVMVTYDA
jgi:hypothetical protein